MMRKAVGFYWTLPVPWRNFTSLPDNVEEAAKMSRTIRYQMEVVRRWVRQENYDLVREGIYLELQPDRAGKVDGMIDETPKPLKALTDYCRSEGATLFYVDFSQEIGWRSHMVMDHWGERHGIRCRQVPVMDAGIEIDGKPFDPRAHFRAWREEQQAWITGKAGRRTKAIARALELQAQGMTQTEIANTLNAEQVSSPTGKRWAADNLRKLLKFARQEEEGGG